MKGRSRVRAVLAVVAPVLATGAVVQVQAAPDAAADPVYAASAGFSSVQGQNGWRYQTRPAGGGAYTDMTFSSGAWRGTGTEPWLTGTAGHPGPADDAVRTWVAPYTGTVAITGTVAKADTSSGNGIVATVLRNSTALWTRTVAYDDSTGYSTDADLGAVPVTAGDSIHFAINNNGSYGADATNWNPTVTYGVAPVTWVASDDFSPTQGTDNWRYQQRAIGTQTFTDMTFSTGAWRGGGGNWIYLNNFHPDNGSDAVRTWVAPAAGTVNVTGRAFKIDLSGGNGVVVSVQKNSTALWSTTLAKDDWKGTYVDGALAGIPVQPGDQLHFIVNNNGDWGADETAFDPAVSYAGTWPANTTYYLSAAGNDANSGTDSAHPWRTVARVNRVHYFGAGVQILFRGGDTFAGGLTISMVGTAASRDVLGTYGTGHATLTDLVQPASNTATADIAVLGNSEYVTVQHLNFAATPGTNFGTTSFVSVNHSTGLKIYSTRASGTKWRSVYLDDDVFRHNRLGAWLDAHESPALDGYDDVRVTNSTFDSTPLIGVIVYSYNAFAGGPVNQHSNVYVGNDTFVHNYGDPNFPYEAQPIEVIGTTGLVIEKNKVTDNCGYGGYNPLGGSTAIGIANSRNFRIQYNEVSGTKSSTRYDGSAIDADQDSQNGEIAGNLTYGNGGPAIQIGSFGGKTSRDIAVHDNVSYNDVRGNTGASVQGAIRLWGHTDALQIFNNTIHIDQAGTAAGSKPSALSYEGVDSGTNENVKVWNNILQTTGGIPMIRPNQPGEDNPLHISGTNQFLGNLYDSSGASLTISTDDTLGHTTAVTSLAAWRADGQEHVGTTNYGVAAPAGLTGSGAPAGYLPAIPVSAYTGLDLTATSPARGQALNPSSILTETAPITVGTADFHGSTAPLTDIGADTY